MARTTLRPTLFLAALLATSLTSPTAAAEPPLPFDPEKAAIAAQVEDPAEATRAYLDAVPKERRAKTKAYAGGNYVLDLVDVVFSNLVLLALLAGGISARMRERAEALFRQNPSRPPPISCPSSCSRPWWAFPSPSTVPISARRPTAS